MTEEQRFEEMLQKKHMVDSADEIKRVVTDFLNDKADRTKEMYPYATTTIAELEKAAYIVSCIFDEI